MRNNKYIPIIGLEVHVELKTKSKMFCGCSADYFGQKPNTHTCPVCLGLPGALPVPNRKAIEWCVMIGLALNCDINNFSKFDRKNYFYPDLPKGYQISQYDEPFCSNGYVILSKAKDPIKKDGDSSATSQNDNARGKKIGITRVHMEEDTAKLTHQSGTQNSKLKTQNDEGYSLIDFNRSGVPLVEIVTEPDFENVKEVIEYLKKLQQIVRYLGVSDADMEKGNMRLEPNVSLQKRNTTNTTNKQILPIYKVEVKNINSFRFVEKAIEYEIKRQTELLESGETPKQETRGWDEDKQKTVSQRTKEEAQDYRYFPEPDIPPIRFTESQISNLKSQMPELPNDKFLRFKKSFELSEYDSEILTREKTISNYFEESVSVGKKHNVVPKQIANVIINKKIDIDSILPAALIEMIVKTKQLSLIDEKELEQIIKPILLANKKAVEDYRSGHENAIMFLIGQIMKKSGLKLDAKKVKEMLKKVLQ